MGDYAIPFWLTLNLLSLVVLSFYSMMEMACISFDKVRMQYYVAKGDQRIIWLSKLLSDPAALFGTTLIGVNFALVVGSECARELFQAIGLPPSLGAIPQIIIVIIVGELAPMFAARRHPEHVVMLGIPLIWLSSKVLTPFLYIVGKVTSFFTKLFGEGKSHYDHFLGRDELQKLLEIQDDNYYQTADSEEFNHIIYNIFSIGESRAKEVMRPFETLEMVPSKCLVSELRQLCKKSKQTFFPLYTNSFSHIIGIVHVRDLLRAQDNKRVRDYARSPWFVEEGRPVIEILKEFRTNNERLAIVLNKKGEAIGYITLDHALDVLFGSIEGANFDEENRMVLIDRTLDAGMTIESVESQFQIPLDAPKEMTIAELCKEKLGEHPEVGESFSIGTCEITILETTLLEIKKVRLKSKVI